MEIYTTEKFTPASWKYHAAPDRNLASRESNLSDLWSQTPFRMPPDEEVLKMRAVEKVRLKEHKRLQNALHVSEKTTFASQLGATRCSEELKQDLQDIDARVEREMENRKSLTVLPVEHYHKEKENMAEFLRKKREIFLVQMSLDRKRAEIRKLEDKIFQREEALRKSEEMLAEDSLEFDKFLKKNDERVQEAIRKSEQQTRLKQDKVAEAKRLSSSISGIKRDLNKFKEQLEECKKYKDFLLGITPKEWFEERPKAINSDADSEKTSEPSTSNEAAPSENDEEEEMYFHTPSQLLEIFNAVEEKNLTLMQDCQDNETAVEDLRNKLAETKESNDAKIASLRKEYQSLRTALKAGDETQSRLQNKTLLNMVDRKYEIPSEEILAKVAEVYARCGFEIDQSLGAIQMLTNIESKLEENVLAIDGVPHDFIEQTEKSREKDRRLRIRAERLEKVREEQEKRALRSLERAQAPVHRRVGKPVMFRSYLATGRRGRVQNHIKPSDDRELVDFLARAY